MSTQIYSWDGAGSRRPYVWKSKQFLQPYPVAFQACQVKADDYASLMLSLYADGVLVASIAVASAREFVLPEYRPASLIEVQLSGTSRVRTLQLAETMEELQ